MENHHEWRCIAYWTWVFHVNYVSLPEGICQAHSIIDPCQVFGHIPWIFLIFHPKFLVQIRHLAHGQCWGLRWCTPALRPQSVRGTQVQILHQLMARWWQLTYFFMFTPKIGEMIQFDKYFSDGLKPPTRWVFLDNLYFCFHGWLFFLIDKYGIQYVFSNNYLFCNFCKAIFSFVFIFLGGFH